MVEVKRRLFMEASGNDWEARAVLNPCVVVDKEGVEHMFYRGVAKDWVSSVGYARIVNGKIERFDKPVLKPSRSYDIKGTEDPRVTKVGGVYYMLYTAYDGKDARIAYAVSKDLRNWKKKGIISPNISVVKARKIVKIKKYRDKWKKQEIYGTRVSLWDKDAVLLPEKIGGKFVMFHRFMPDVQIVKFRNFKELKRRRFWENYVENLSEGEDKVSLYRRYKWEGEHVGAGAVPVKTKKGWLLIYHGVELKRRSFFIDSWNRVFYKIEGVFRRLRNKRLPLVYHVGAALLDLKKPETEIARLRSPLFSPKYNWEKEGDISDVVFPEGAVVKGNKLKIYYGCSDSRIGLAEVNLRGLFRESKRFF
jgi:beta-1,2-mannobiose phosphorylase / 1,2-beta-oligomannan phosphorylase